MIITLYSDEECTEAVWTGLVGDYSKIDGVNGIVITETATKLVNGEKTIKMTQLWRYNRAKLKMGCVPDTFDFPRSEESGTTTANTKYYYLSPLIRLVIKTKQVKEGSIYVRGICFYTAQTIVNNTWTNMTAPHENYVKTFSNTEPFAITFATGKTATWGGTHKIANSNFFGVNITRQNSTMANETSWCEFAFSPYDQLFSLKDPDAYKPNTTPMRGGYGTGTVPRGTIPALPVDSINSLLMSTCQGYGRGLSYYKLTTDALSNITKRMYPKFDFMGKSAATRQEAFVSLVGIPYNVPTTSNSGGVYLADTQVAVASGTADWVTSLCVPLNFGTFYLEGNLTDTFADVVYTEYTLYLAGVGNISIDPAACAQGYVRVSGMLDVRNGNILYAVYTYAKNNLGEVIYAHASGNVGIEIPLSGGTANTQFVKNATTLGISTASAWIGAVSGNPTLLGAGIVGAIKGTESTFEDAIGVPHISKANTLDPMAGGYGSPCCRLMVSQNYMIMPDKYVDLVGLPSSGIVIYNADNEEVVACKLSDFIGKGFLRIQNIKLENVLATEEEKNELVQLFMNGVFM